MAKLKCDRSVKIGKLVTSGKIHDWIKNFTVKQSNHLFKSTQIYYKAHTNITKDCSDKTESPLALFQQFSVYFIVHFRISDIFRNFQRLRS